MVSGFEDSRRKQAHAINYTRRAHLVLHPLARAQQDKVLLAQARQVRGPGHRAGPRRRL